MRSIFREACVESLNQGVNAARAGADRIELCADLFCDGLTPERDVIEKALQQIREKGYMDRWAGAGRKRIAIGINFSVAKRNVQSWKAEAY